jgi:hypothetical protein
MGLMIYSLDSIPLSASRDYFIYLLDYGWDEPISNIIMRNYDEMAKISAEHEAVVIKGTVAAHFNNEVLSWHNFNGQSTDDLLPAILITNKHPVSFRESNVEHSYKNKGIYTFWDDELKMILIPLRYVCASETDVINIIRSIFKDIKSGKKLENFSVAKDLKKGVNGIGFDIGNFMKSLKR